MKVLHVSDADGWTGGCAQMMALAAGLKRRGWDSWTACRPASALAGASLEAGLRVFPCALRQDYDLLSAWRLAGLAARERFDVLHCHHSRSHGIGLLAALILHVRGLPRPVLVVSRRVSFKAGRNPFSAVKYRSPLIDAYTAVAGAVREVLACDGVDPARVAVVHSGVDVRRFAPAKADPQARRSLGIPEGALAVGKIANYAPWKGQTCFLEAAAMLAAGGRPLHFVLVGRGTDGPELKAEVERLGLQGRVTLAGFREDVPRVLSCLSVSVNAAVGGEGLSGVIRESLAMQVPGVASDVAGNRELFGGRGGDFLFPPGDARALADRIRWVLDHPAEARAAAAALGERVRAEFGVEAMIDKTERLYLALLSNREPAPAPEPGRGPAAAAGLSAAVAFAHALAWVAALLLLLRFDLAEARLAPLGFAGAAFFACALGFASSRWLALSRKWALAGILAAPFLALAFSFAKEPELFMHLTMADGASVPVFVPDPAWRGLSLWWTGVSAAFGFAGWLAGLLLRRWPARHATRPPAGTPPA